LIARGYTYVDVRSEPEFVTGHPPGAVNVPLQIVEGDRLVDNCNFVEVMSSVFRTGDPLVIGCRSGSRSRIAVERLESAGFERLVELRHGFHGARDAFGRRLPGWLQQGYPVEEGDGMERSYASILERARTAERG
jgi:rhodanese-related sulfurtransferase